MNAGTSHLPDGVRVVCIGQAHVGCFNKATAASPRIRSRVCAHTWPDTAVHEMFIVHHRSSTIVRSAAPLKPDPLR